MFRQQGKRRTFQHNLMLAVSLSFIAGLVNISSVLTIKALTTNVTGHVVFFAEEILKSNWTGALFFFMYAVFFLLGALVSGILTELTNRTNPKVAHAGPMLIEILVLTLAGLESYKLLAEPAGIQIMACMLLFAMGIQNSLVTRISKAVVRTTHLTGLFTDLGLELSQLFFYRQKEQLEKLYRSIKLRSAIIFSFLIGGLSGGVLHQNFGFNTFLIAAFCLFIALFFDSLKLRYYYFKRSVKAFETTSRRGKESAV
jgi:uncharacterized membrane protein YoaK (UPF0700 family)